MFQTWRAGSFCAKGEKRKPYDAHIAATTIATRAPVNPIMRTTFRQRAATRRSKRVNRIVIGSRERIGKVAKMTATRKKAGADILARKSPDQLSAVMTNQRLFKDWSNWKKLQVAAVKKKAAVTSAVISAECARRLGSKTASSSEIRPPIAPNSRFEQKKMSKHKPAPTTAIMLRPRITTRSELLPLPYRNLSLTRPTSPCFHAAFSGKDGRDRRRGSVAQRAGQLPFSGSRR